MRTHSIVSIYGPLVRPQERDLSVENQNLPVLATKEQAREHTGENTRNSSQQERIIEAVLKVQQ